MNERRTVPIIKASNFLPATFVLYFVVIPGLTKALSAQVPASQVIKTEAPSKLEFDVASIRRNKTGDPNAVGDRSNVNVPTGPEDTFRDTGGVFRATNICIRILISFAYKITTSQSDAFRASLPDWAMTDGYDIEARTDAHNVTKDGMREMMKSLLADRFNLKIRYDTHTVPVYAVVLVKPSVLGPNLRLHPADEPCSNIAPSLHPSPDAQVSSPPLVPAGFPVTCGGFANMKPLVPGLHHEGSRNMPMSTIVTAFRGLGNLGRPAIDQTGLTGNYDWFIEYKSDSAENDSNSDIQGPIFEEALKNQLGLKLVPVKAPFDSPVVDHIDRPSDN